MSKLDELVLGLPRSLIPGGLDWRGVRPVALEPYLAAVAEHGSFRPRGEAEADPTWKQIIPYVVLRDGELHLSHAAHARGRR